MCQKDNIKTGIVFSGGIAKGAYQIGFCKALENHNFIQILAISSASIGVLNGYALSVGKISEAEDLWKNVNIKGYKQIYNKIFKSKLIYDLIEELHSESDKLNITLYSSFWTPPTIKPKYISLKSLDGKSRLDYLKASVSLPPIMKPVIIDDVKFYDGAIVDNTPISPLSVFKLDLIICIQFDGYIPAFKSNEISCPILFLNLQNKCCISDSFHLDKTQIESMIDYGYTVGENTLTLIEKNYRDYESFLKFISYYNSQLKENPISGDYLVRRINRISKRL